MRDKGRVSFSCNLFQDEILFSHRLCTSGWFLYNIVYYSMVGIYCTCREIQLKYTKTRTEQLESLGC